MKRIGFVLTLLVLAGCGADGAPFRPFAELGVSAGSGGVSTNCTMGGTNGRITISAVC